MKRTMIFFATAAVLVIACNHESAPASGVTTTGAGVVSNEDAVRRLTDARCDRAKACNQLGDKEKYKDEAACRREERHDLEADLRPGECPRGIKDEKLSNCLQEIRNEKCGNPFDKVSRLATCRTGSLCID
ncbi:MAG: hypothetical protein JWP87_850 [Labilithrix sp.]|nr:hypothetical protein [Labilithrix sp.]